MRAVRVLGNRQVELVDVPPPEPAVDQVVVRVTASGVCGGEMHAYRGSTPLDLNQGHEVTGVIADPNGHPQWAEGDPVGVFTLQGCGVCRWCRKGQDTFCKRVGGPSPCHSEFIVSRATGLVPLPAGVPLGVAVLLCGDGLGVPYGATTRAGVYDGDVTAVFGCGPVGLGMVLVQSFLGALPIGVEPNEHRRKLAKKMGAWQVVDPGDTDVVARLLEMTDGIGPDASFEAVGRQDALDWALDATKPEGVVMLVGHGPQSIDPQRLIVGRNMTLSGNWVAHPAKFPEMLAMFRDGLDAERLITLETSPENASVAYARFDEGLEAKVILRWDG
jgi:threonine dehydrogenase-like Zn-dependent dehydrogenase